jgi:hypothetical protein
MGICTRLTRGITVLKSVGSDKILAILVSLLLTLGSVLYSNALSRVSALEADRKDLVGVAQAISVQTAVMEARLAALETEQKTLADVIAQNTKDYQNALSRWEAIVDRFIRNQ